MERDPKPVDVRFGPQVIRQGAIGFHGLVSPGTNTGDISDVTNPNRLAQSSLVAVAALLSRQGITLGEVDLAMVRNMTWYFKEPIVNFYTLLGDPTLAMKINPVAIPVQVVDGQPGVPW